ncbi:MAG TPA: helix-hairpin-helix domain-containing protein [Acidimicrobiales bacterium]
MFALLADLGLSPRVAAAGCAVGLIALLGWLWLRSPAPPTVEAGMPMAPAAAGTLPGAALPVAPVGDTVLAHAAGAVRHPGLYELAAGERVADLLEAAGGATRAADLDRVNLAAPVADGTQVIVPRRGEPAPTLSTPTDGSSPSATPAAPVNINLAGPEELETLPGVGPATAAAIIEYRDANGPFASADELIDVPGIGEAKLAAVADLVTV